MIFYLLPMFFLQQKWRENWGNFVLWGNTGNGRDCLSSCTFTLQSRLGNKCNIPVTTGAVGEEGENGRRHWKGRKTKEREVKGLKWKQNIEDQNSHCPFQLNVKKSCPLDVTKVLLVKQPTGWTYLLSSCISNPIGCHRIWSNLAMLLIIMPLLCFGCRCRWHHPLR